MEKIYFNERLVWADTVKKYPHKWVGLSAVDWSEGKILSAVVKYVDDSIDKIFDRQIITPAIKETKIKQQKKIP